MNRALMAVAAFLLATAFSPKLSDTEAEEIRLQREQESRAFYPNLSIDDAYASSLKVLHALDQDDLIAEKANGKVLGARRYSIYQVFVSTAGIDYYEVLATPKENGVEVQVRFDRAFTTGMATHSMPLSYKEGLGIYGRQGATIDDYRLFHRRLDAVLNGRAWIECKGLPKIEKSGPLFMCNAPGLSSKPFTTEN